MPVWASAHTRSVASQALVHLSSALQRYDSNPPFIEIDFEDNTPPAHARLTQVALSGQSLGQPGIKRVRCDGINSVSESFFSGSINAIQSLDDRCFQPDLKTHKPRCRLYSSMVM